MKSYSNSPINNSIGNLSYLLSLTKRIYFRHFPNKIYLEPLHHVISLHTVLPTMGSFPQIWLETLIWKLGTWTLNLGIVVFSQKMFFHCCGKNGKKYGKQKVKLPNLWLPRTTKKEMFMFLYAIRKCNSKLFCEKNRISFALLEWSSNGVSV